MCEFLPLSNINGINMKSQAASGPLWHEKLEKADSLIYMAGS